MRNTITEKIKNRIMTFESDTVFIANDFIDLADYETARKVLNRLSDDKIVKKVSRGLYYCPRFSEILGEYEAPSPHEVALAIARKFNWNIAPSGTTALNMLGLSTQVSSKWSYISDGAYNRFDIGNVTIEFKHRNNREISGMSYKTALIIQGIKALGKKNIDYNVIKKIRSSLTKSEQQHLLYEAKPTTAWVYGVIKRICEIN